LLALNGSYFAFVEEIGSNFEMKCLKVEYRLWKVGAFNQAMKLKSDRFFTSLLDNRPMMTSRYLDVVLSFDLIILLQMFDMNIYIDKLELDICLISRLIMFE
jgi:hypothetical protein